MAIVKVQKIPRKKSSSEDLLALFCYYFPQYTYYQARKLPYARVRQMLRVVNKEYARRMLDMLQIVSAPHGKKGNAKSLFEKFNDIINE